MAGILHHHIAMFEPGFPIKGFSINLQNATFLFKSANTAGQSRFPRTVQTDNGNRFSNGQFCIWNIETFRLPLFIRKAKILKLHLFSCMRLILIIWFQFRERKRP